MKIVIYTALFGEIDRLWSLSPLASRGARCVAYTNRSRSESGLWASSDMLRTTASMPPLYPTWEQLVIEPEFESPRKNARYAKVLSHIAFPEADIFIWVDANIRPRVAPKDLIKFLGKNDMAILKHPDRDCVYQEIEFCSRHGKGSSVKLEKQRKAYEQEGMPKHWGLPATRCVIRRNTDKIRKLNEDWWEQISQYSIRDQVSLPYVAWKNNMKWSIIPGKDTGSKLFWYVRHGDKW